RVHVAAAEAHEVAISHMRADADAARRRLFHHLADARRVARVKAAGDVGAGDDAEHGNIVAHRPGAEAFAQVTVEVDLRHDTPAPMFPYLSQGGCPNNMSRPFLVQGGSTITPAAQAGAGPAGFPVITDF